MSKRLASILIILLVIFLLTASLALAYYIVVRSGPATPPLPPSITRDLTTSRPQINPSYTPTAISPGTSETVPTEATLTPAIEITPTHLVSTTATPEPSLTVSSTASPTLEATLTPDRDVCSRVSIQFRRVTSNIVLWQLNNMNYQPSAITRISISWPKENFAVFNAFLDGNVIWSGGDLVSPTIISEWLGGVEERQVLGTTRLEFLFGENAEPNGYDITVDLDNGCSVSTSN